MYTRLAARADQLKAAGPGTVRVEKLNDIETVQKLRSARAALTAAEQAAVDAALAELRECLTGVEQSTNPVEKPSVWRRLAGVAGFGVGSGLQATERERHDRMVNAAGGPADLPPPATLIEAAEAWLIAGIVEEGMGESLDVLRRPWEAATVDR